MTAHEDDPRRAWRRWCAERGVHPVEALLEIRRLYTVRVPSHPDREPLRLGHVDERAAELRPLIVEAVRRVRERREQRGAA